MVLVMLVSMVLSFTVFRHQKPVHPRPKTANQPGRGRVWPDHAGDRKNQGNTAAKTLG